MLDHLEQGCEQILLAWFAPATTNLKRREDFARYPLATSEGFRLEDPLVSSS